jgi:predicted ATPase
LLCLDDLHWADTATLNWLIGVTGRLTNTRFRIVATYRSGEADALTAVRRSFRRANCLTEVPLAGLTPEAIVQILHQLHLPWSEALVKIMAGRLHRATGGNTFFVLETIRTLLANDNLAEPPQRLPLAATVEEVIRSRLAQLTAVSQQIIQAAAVLSPHLPASLIQHTAGRTELELADGLDELTARHLLQEIGNGHRFNHALVQTAVYQEITPWRRKTLHR